MPKGGLFDGRLADESVLLHLVDEGGDFGDSVAAVDNLQGGGVHHERETDDGVGILPAGDGLDEGARIVQLMRAAADAVYCPFGLCGAYVPGRLN